MWHKWQYISQGATPAWHLRHIRSALDSGTQWIQLRLKGEDEKTVCTTGQQVAKYCQLYGARFVLNDYTALVTSVGADGVHLGLQDGSVEHARKILGAGKVIGGTANTFEDVCRRIEEGCDYIGLGPFRFTRTKAKLSPLLGIEGYRRIMTRLDGACRDQAIKLCPIYAIGGIGLDDMAALYQTGVYGMALSGLLTMTEDKTPYNQQITQLKAITNQIKRITDD